MSFTTNIQIQKTYPAVEYEPSSTETDGVWHEDHEIAGVMYRAANATFDETHGTWSLKVSSQPAYAAAQDAAGSIHYYSMPASSGSWTVWNGSENNTIYNAEDFGTTAGGSASSNSTALTSLFTTMVTAAGLGGGTARIPQYNFPVQASETGIMVPPGPTGNGLGGCIIQGLGTGGQSGTNQAFHFSITDPPLQLGPFIFLICNAAHTSGGSFFKNLAFQWVEPGPALNTCLSLNYWGNGVDSCTFTNCPTAMNFQSLAGSARRCQIVYGVNISTPTNVTAIIVQGNQNEISGPSEMNGNGLSGTNTSTCVLIGGGVSSCEHNTIRNIHVYGWNYGIDYKDVNDTGTGSGTSNDVIDGCKLDCIRSCINLVPASSAPIFNQVFSNNTIIKSQTSTFPDPIVYIDCNTAGGGVAANIGPIVLVNNVIWSDVNSNASPPGSAQENQYGVQIGTCEAVSIIGGQISNVGTKSHAGSDGTANICISGNPVSVIISDVNLAAAYVGVNSGRSTGMNGSAASEFALLITGNPSNVQVDNCYIGGGWAGSPVSVTGAPGSLVITNCPGYNDQNTNIVGSGMVSTGTPYKAATAGTVFGGTAVNYYGPSFVMFRANASGGTFQYNGGTAQTLLASQVVCLTLASPYDTITFNTHAPAAFAWTGA